MPPEALGLALAAAVLHASWNVLLRDAEALRTDWARGQHTTETQARQTDRHGATAWVFGQLIAEAEAGNGEH